MMRATLIRALLLAAITLAPVAAWAQSCSVVAGAMVFGTFSGLAVDTTATTITVTCTPGLAYSLNINAGLHSGGTTYGWQMQSVAGANPLPYRIYRDAAHTQPFGNTAHYDGLSGTGTGLPQSYTAYGQIAVDSAVIAGAYIDTVTVSVFSAAMTATGVMAVTAAVPPSCSVSAAPLAFGTYAGAEADASTTIIASCTNLTAYAVGVNDGLHSGGSDNWNMAGPAAALLNYGLYRDAAHTLVWGLTQNGNEVTGLGTGIGQPITLYGKVAAGQAAPAGSYTDSVTVVLSY